MAEVFRADDQRLGRHVAVKVLSSDLLADARAVDRFDREARAVASLNHPNIVDVYDAVSEGETHAIVMELIEGPTLADIIEQDGHVDPRDAIPVAVSIADALQAAHDRGLVHHDVKPRNVLFDRDGNVKVADFGIARAASSDITTVQGSPPYLAPEQARGGRSDARSDVYALGCVLYEMLTGRPPFAGDSASAIVMQHIDAPVPPLSSAVTDLPDGLESVVMRALAKDPDQRYQSPADLRADLDRVAAGLSPVGATIVSTPSVASRDATMVLGDDGWHDPAPQPPDEEPVPRRGAPAWVVAVLVLAVVVLAVVAFTRRSDPEPAVADTSTEQPEPEPAPDQQDPQDADEPANDQEPQPDGGTGEDADRLAQVTDRIEELVAQDRQEDQETVGRLEQLRDDLDNAVAERSQDGTTPSEAGRLDQLRDRLDTLVEDSDAGEGIAERIQRIVDDINPFGNG